jgi:poly-gamma-glutamate synthesis protein (capsule biosynthesis protein)
LLFATWKLSWPDSLGNFISDQRLHYTDTGIILLVEIAFDAGAGRHTFGEVSYIPTWVHKYHCQNRLHYRILPVPQAIEAYQRGADPLLDPGSFARLQAVLKETREHLGYLKIEVGN